MQSKGERLPRQSKRAQYLAEAKRRERAAGQKVSRIRGQGVSQAYEVDPRAHGEVNNMSTQQLKSHINKLNRFIDRGNQYVAGAGGTPISRSAFNAYKAEETAFNAKGTALEKEIGGLKLPGQDGTVNQLLSQRWQARTTGGDNRIFAQVNRQPFNFGSPEDVVAMTQAMKKKNQPNYLQQALKPRLNSLYALLRNSGNEDFISKVNDMSDEQLNVLLDYSTFTSIAQERFSSGDTSVVDKEDAAYYARTGVQREDDIRDELQTVFDWALNVASANTQGTIQSGPNRAARRAVAKNSRSPKRKG